MSQYCKFISKASISCTGILHTEAGGIRQEDPWLTFQFSRKRMTWKGRTLFPEQPLMKMLCFSVHTLWATVQSKCMLAQGMGGGGVQRGPLSLQTAPGRLDFQLHDEASEKQGWLHAPEERGSANFTFMRGGGDQNEGAAACGGTHQCYAAEGLTMQPTVS